MLRVAGLFTLIAVLSAAAVGQGTDGYVPPPRPAFPPVYGPAEPSPPDPSALPLIPSDPPAWNAPKPAAPHAQPTPAPSASPEVPVTFVNGREFCLHADVQDAGPAPPKVQVWLTRDGRAWQQIKAVDAGGPIRVAVAAEGRYGFRLVARSEAKLGDPTPTVGTPPQHWVDVDVTPPTVTLEPAQVVHHDGKRFIRLVWKAADRNLTSHPISLSWSAGQGGPWEPIGEPHLANAGEHIWTPKAGVPPRVHLQIVARDKAGNVSSFTTPEAVVVDTSLPLASIRKVEPVRPDNAGRKEPPITIPAEPEAEDE